MSAVSARMASAREFSAPTAVVLSVGGLYVGQSIIGGLSFFGLPSVLRERGLPLDRIGLIYLSILPWALKFLWSPVIERYRSPKQGVSRSRVIVLVGGVISALGLSAVAFAGVDHPALLVGFFILIAFAASTVDIACDGHAVEALSEKHHGWGNAAQVGGAYLGSAIGSGLFLVLVELYGWRAATFAMAALLLVLALPFLLSQPRPSPGVSGHQPSLRNALRRDDMRAGLALAAVYVVAQKWGLSMLGPFLVDSGLDLTSLGMINGVGGMIVGFLCALAGGALVRIFGARTIMTFALVLQALALAGLAFAALRGGFPQAALVALAIASSSGLMAFGFVALYAQFMALADARQAGVDFTLLQCMDALVSMAGGVCAGFISQHFGYGACFALAAIFAAIAAPAVWRLARRAAQASDLARDEVAAT
ncbi:MFS transporter [Terrarubrum flagellatum]|uniref:MFS transporter n=1 Tax=Terrirubrum flagellatum TaxID=2895980 RepID=UPI0031452941